MVSLDVKFKIMKSERKNKVKVLIRKSVKKCISYLFIMALLCQLPYGKGIIIQSVEAGDEQDRIEKDDTIPEKQEIKSERTEFSTTYEYNDGKRETEIYSAEVRYRDEETGRLLDYDANLTEVTENKTELGTSLDDYAYENKQGDKKHYFPLELDESTPVISEFKNYQFAMAPMASDESDVSIDDKEKVEDIYGNLSEETDNVLYCDIKKNTDIEIISSESGLKENIILKKKPDNNIFYYKINTVDCHPELEKVKLEGKDTEYTQVNLVDDKSNETVGIIPRPYMFDSSEDRNYSDECYYTLRKNIKGTYILGVCVSNEYLNSEDTIYPVNIDPSLSWQQTVSCIDATFTADARMQEATFYNNNTLQVGKYGFSYAESYIKFPKIYSYYMKNYSVYDMQLTLTETAESVGGKNISIHDVLGEWDAPTLNYNNAPAFRSSKRKTFYSKGKENAVTTLTISGYINEMRRNSVDYAKRGFVLRTDDIDSSKISDAAVFYSPRESKTSYRPKLTLWYYEKPTKPSSVNITSYKRGIGNTLNIVYSGVQSQILDYVYYKVERYNDDTKTVSTKLSDVISYSSNTMIGTASNGCGTIDIGTVWWSGEGCYRVSVCGVDKNGIRGNPEYAYIHIDNTSPEIKEFRLDNTIIDGKYVNEQPVLKWEISDKHLSDVYIKFNDMEYVRVGCSLSGQYTVPYACINNGTNLFALKAIDSAGNEIESQKININYDGTCPILTGRLNIETSPLNYSNRKDVQFTVASNEGLRYLLYSINNEPYRVYNENCSYVKTMLPDRFFEGESGLKTIRFKGIDNAANESNELILKYYYDGKKQEMDATIYPESSANTYQSEIPNVNFSIEEDNYESMTIYSEDDNRYITTTESSGSINLPVDWFNESGNYTFKVVAEDTAGNISEQSLNYYYNNSSVKASEYVPKNITARERLDGTTELIWDKVYDDKLPSDISYDVYQGMSEDKVDILVASGYRSNEIVIDKQAERQKYYYKIVAKKKLSSGEEYDLAESEVISSTTYGDDEKKKRLGYDNYLRYLNYDLPCGTGRVEESTGNFYYSQLDTELSGCNNFIFTRIYNSQSNRIGILGKGWMSWYERCLYINNDSRNVIICENGDGSFKEYKCTDKTKTAYTSDRDEGSIIFAKYDGVYEQIFKSGEKYIYNRLGRMAGYENNSGQRVSIVYDESNRNVSEIIFEHKVNSEYIAFYRLRLEYKKHDNGLMLLEKVTMSNGTSIMYEYSGSELVQVIVKGDKGENTLNYKYHYDNGMLEKITDATGKNNYSIVYDASMRVSKCIYPDNTRLCLYYNVRNNKCSYEKRTAGGDIIYSGQTKYNDNGYYILTQDGSDAVDGGAVYTYNYDSHRLTGSNKNISYNSLVDKSIEQKTDLIGDVFEYNSSGNVTEETYGDGTSIKYIYGLTGNITKNLPTQIIKTYKNKTTGNTDTIGHVKLTYNENGNVLSLTDVINDESIKFTYDDNGQVVEQTTEKQEKTSEQKSYKYNEFGKVKSENTIAGTVNQTTKYEYDNDGTGKLISEITEDADKVVEYEYDSFGREIRCTERIGAKIQETTREYDNNGNITKEVQPSGVTYEYTYDSMNRTTAEKIISKSKTSVTYWTYEYTDVSIRVSKVTKSEGEYYTKKYTGVLCTTVKDESGHVMKKTYTDDLGHVIREDSEGVLTDYQYDNQGNVTSSMTYGKGDSDSICYAYSYDKNGNLTETLTNPYIHSDNIDVTESTIVNRTIYDSKGNVFSETDGNGDTTYYKYSEDNKLTEIWLPGDKKASKKYEYSVSVGNSCFTDRETDIKGSVSETITNAAGQIVCVQDIGYDGTKLSTKYEYDKFGNVTKQINGNGSYVLYTYNKENLCTSKSSYDYNNIIQTYTSYGYDSMNNLTNMEDYAAMDSNGSMDFICSTYYRYNQWGELIAEGQINISPGYYPTEENIEASLTHYTYNNKGMLLQKDYPANSGGILSEYYEYNAKGQLTSVKAKVSGISSIVTLATYSYTSRGKLRVSEETMSPTNINSDKLIRSYTYDSIDRVAVVEYSKKSNNQFFERYSYMYDDNSNIIYEKLIGEKTEERTYKYSSKGQLTKTDITINGASSYPYIYEYDSVGNCVKMTNGYTEEMNYNGLNQLVSKVQHVGSDISSTYQYDENGNQTCIYTKGSGSDFRDTVTYDPLNRMTSKSRTYIGQTETLLQKNAYNGNDQRVESTYVSSSGTAVYESYHYSREQLSYVENGEHKTTAKYVYNNSGGVILREEKATSGNGKNYISYTKDIRGSSRTLLSQTGKKLVSYTYDDYGSTRIQVASDNTAKIGYDNHLCFTGGVYDKATATYYLNARYYSPSNRNFLTQDTYRGTKEDAMTWNLYGYCGGNPVGYTDPSGHEAISATLLGMTVAELIGILVKSIMVIATADATANLVQNISESEKVHVKPAEVQQHSSVAPAGINNNSSSNNKLPKRNNRFKKYIEKKLNNFSANRIKHIINGSNKNNHHWEYIVPNKDWRVIRKIILKVIMKGEWEQYKSVDSFIMEIKGYVVQVTGKISDGLFEISDAWIKK